MKIETLTANDKIDPAAVFGAASSLWSACHKYAKKDRCNLSEIFNGTDQFMRVAMSVANRFEQWSCQHVDFEALTDVWPYLLQDKFGDACLDILSLEEFESFDDRDCMHVAMRLRLPIRPDGTLPIPLDVIARNPESESPFRAFRIQTVRTSIEDDDVSVYAWDDDPFDDEFSKPYYGLYGVNEDGTVEYIADRQTYSEIMSLAKKLAPTVEFSAR
jgi:hypothetical protein